MSESPVRVMIVDDQAPFRLAARMVVGRTDGFEVVGEAASGEESLDRAAELEPDLVLMDINMGEMSGIEAARQMIATRPSTTVFLCSTYSRADLPPDALDGGATAYINKEELGPALLTELWHGSHNGN